MLQQNNFFADGSWIVKECVLIYLLNGSSLVFFISNSINVNEMEQVRRCHNFGTVVEEYSERAWRQFVTKTILAAEVYKFWY